MGKSFRGVNIDRIIEGRARKMEQKERERNQRKKNQEDEQQWIETDPRVLKKLHRREEREEKQHCKVQRKKDNKTLEAQESDALFMQYGPKPKKMTRAEVQEAVHQREKVYREVDDHKNINQELRLIREQENYKEARSIEDAIHILNERIAQTQPK